jgi:hypothetical protein
VKRLVAWLAKILFLVLLAGVFVLTNDLFFMVGGSQDTSFLVAPQQPVQIFLFIVCAVLVLVPATRSRRIVFFIIALLAALTGGHRLLIDNLHHEIKDVYLAIPFQAVSLDPASEAGLVIQPVFGGIKIGPRDTNRSLTIISPPFIGLDRHQLAALGQ